VHDQTSILKFIETKFNLGAMTYRDANANDLTDCLDFKTAAFRDPPTLVAPRLVPPAVSACQPGLPPLPALPS
jgi:phospholipase C